MHVLFHSSWYPNRLQPTLGNFVQRHAEAVATLHEVTVLHTVSDPSITRNEVVVHERGQLREVIVHHPHGRLGALASIQAMRAQLSGIPAPDLIHGHVLRSAAAGMLWLRRILGVPMIITEHWTGYHPAAGVQVHWAVRALMRRAASKAAFLCPVSDDLGRAMQDFGLAGRYRTIPNVVDTATFTPGAPRGDGRFRLLHVSTLHDVQKNITGLLRAFAEAHRLDPRLQLVIASDGDPIPYHGLVAELGLAAPHLMFVGPLPPAGIAGLMREADAFVMASRYENMPCVILEALAAALPVLSTSVGGIAEVINSDRGILVPADDHGHLVQALMELPHEKDRMDLSHIRQYADERFSINAVAAAFDKCYSDALDICR